MAKPLQNSETPISSFQFSSFDSFSSLPSPGSRKRFYDSVPVNSDDLAFARDDETHKTRRVNPLRLATRLGADLVAEMEALIVPGAKMPNFTVRKDFQERYSVDRRHIYDYFHSRGLRVAKEDKHTNLTRGRLSKARLHQSPKIKSEPATEKEISDMKMEVSIDLNLKPAKKPLIKIKKRPALTKTSGVKPQRRFLTPSCVSPIFSCSPPKKRPRISRAEDDDEESLWVRPNSPCPEFTMDGKFSDPSSLGDTCDSIYDQPFEYLRGLDETISDFSLELPFENSVLDPLAAVEEHRPLTEMERTELYNLINNSIGSPEGIQESRGTYCAYMKERSRLYYDRLFFRTSYRAIVHRAHHGSLRSSTKPMEDEVDFRKWLSGPIHEASHLDTHVELDSSRQAPFLLLAKRESEFEPGPSGLLDASGLLSPSQNYSLLEEPMVEYLEIPSHLDIVQKGAQLSPQLSPFPRLDRRDRVAEPLSGRRPSGRLRLERHHSDIGYSFGRSSHFIEEGLEVETFATQIIQPTALHFRYDSGLRKSPGHSFLPPPTNGEGSPININHSKIKQLNGSYKRRLHSFGSSTASGSLICHPVATEDSTSLDILRASDFVNANTSSSDHPNAFRSVICNSRPFRLRTASAGGGI